MANFTDNKIKNTYQRVLQVDNGIIQDGLGNAVSASISSITGSFSGSFDGILTGPTSESLALRVSNQENFSSSLDNTYATDNELEAVSSSLAVETAQLLNFSSSLDSTYATDTDLNIVSASVDQLNIASSSYLFVTSSVPEGQLVFSKGGKEMEHRPNLHFDGIDDLSIGVLTSTGSAGRIHLLTGKNGTSTASLTNATTKLELSRDGIVGVTVDGIKGVLKYSGSDRVIPTANGVRINGNISATNVGQTTGSIIALNAATSSYINTDSTIASGQLVYGTGVGKAVESIPNFIFDGSDTLSLGSVADTGSNGRIHFVTGKESGSTASIVNKSHKLEIIRDGIVGLTVDGLKGVLKYSGSDTVIPTSTGVTVVGDVNANNINSLTSSVAALNDATSSYALKTEITGSFTTLSSSLASRLSTNETDIISLGTTNNTQGTLIGNLTSATSSYAVGDLADYQLIVTSSSPSSNSYIIPAVVNCTPSGSTFLTGSPYEDVSILRLAYSGSNGTHILTLPDATTTTNTYRSIRVISNGTVDNQHQVTLQPSASQTLDGGASGFSFNRSYEGVMVWSDGTEWFKVQAKNI